MSLLDPGRDSVTLLHNEKRLFGGAAGRERQTGMGR